MLETKNVTNPGTADRTGPPVGQWLSVFIVLSAFLFIVSTQTSRACALSVPALLG